jgi:hypothetical protein
MQGTSPPSARVRWSFQRRQISRPIPMMSVALRGQREDVEGARRNTLDHKLPDDTDDPLHRAWRDCERALNTAVIEARIAA